MIVEVIVVIPGYSRESQQRTHSKLIAEWCLTAEPPTPTDDDHDDCYGGGMTTTTDHHDQNSAHCAELAECAAAESRFDHAKSLDADSTGDTDDLKTRCCYDHCPEAGD